MPGGNKRAYIRSKYQRMSDFEIATDITALG